MQATKIDYVISSWSDSDSEISNIVVYRGLISNHIFD